MAALLILAMAATVAHAGGDTCGRVHALNRLRWKYENFVCGFRFRAYIIFQREGSSSIVTSINDVATENCTGFPAFVSRPFTTAGALDATPLLAEQDGLELGPGTILAIGINPLQMVTRRGDFHIQIEVHEGPAEPISMGVPLISDYVTADHHVGCPHGVLHQQVEGKGGVDAPPFPDPPVGADVIIPVPRDMQWDLKAWRGVLHTAGNGLARQVMFRISDAAGRALWEYPSLDTQPPGTDHAYYAAPVGGMPVGLARHYLLFPPNWQMLQGWMIHVFAVNKQPGDFWYSTFPTIERWVSN